MLLAVPSRQCPLGEKCPNTDQKKLRIWILFTQWPCLELATVRPELSSNLLMPHAFAYRVLICFC